ncbi:MAG TPA: polyamine aminopropyltransferase, partial [Methylophilaceae bacterium]|nr:polyamine aminopropyltransferase [Methylophilaceae bacterium]
MFKLGRNIHRNVSAGDSVDVSEADGVRSLHLGSPTVQSSMRLSAPHDLELAYTRGIMTFLLFAPEVRKVLAIGLGGGSIPRFIHYYLPRLHTTVVDINPQVIAVARSHFLLPPDDERLHVIEGDGAQYLKEHPGRAELLIIDAFDSRGVPADLCSQDFFDSCAEAVTADGLMAINLWGSDRNYDVYLQRIERSFSHRVLVLPTGRPGNVVVFGFRRIPADLRWANLRERARLLQE